MPYDDGAIEKNKSEKRIRNVGRGGIEFLNSVVRESIAEKMTSEQRSEGGERARHAGNLGRACQQNSKCKGPEAIMCLASRKNNTYVAKLE